METLAPGEIIAERFRVESLLGFGGMGTVYRTRDTVDGTPAAVKLLREVSADDLERFEREAKTLACFRHPGIVGYLGHGYIAEGAWLAMEWVEGATLDQRLKVGRLGRSSRCAATEIATETLGSSKLESRDVHVSSPLRQCAGRPGVDGLAGGVRPDADALRTSVACT